MIFKIFGAILILVGIFLIAKYQLYLVGLILLFFGFYLAMKIGMKPLWSSGFNYSTFIEHFSLYDIYTSKVYMNMKTFILFISLVFGIFAIAIYAKGIKHRIKELTDKSDENK